MNILTLTTDSGEKDHYVASLKGFLLSNVNNISIVDISHQISPFNVSEAARQVRNCIGSFPSGTIHVVGVDDEAMCKAVNALLFNLEFFLCNDLHGILCGVLVFLFSIFHQNK
mgnify:CR=1 FL=1